MSKRINVVLSDQTVALLDKLTVRGARSRFIDKAVQNFIETQGKKNRRKQLIAGYRANAARDLEIAAEWFPLEEEAYLKGEEERERNAGPQKKRA
jgi:CopG family transcriptional regulator/antitoxin EndoAI